MNIRRINFLLSSSKLGKKEIAEKCAVSRTTLDNLLSGADVKISTVEKLAAVLGVTVGDLFDGTPSPAAHANRAESIAAVSREVSVGTDFSDKERIAYLEKLLAEKERLIGVLMGTPGTGNPSPQCPFRTSKKSQTTENK